MAVAPDGSLYFGDWVLRDYPVHGRGRIWRLTLPSDKKTNRFPKRVDEDTLAFANLYGTGPASPELGDPFAHATAVYQLSHDDELDQWGGNVPVEVIPVSIRLAKLEALRLRGTKKAESILREALRDSAAEVRLYAVRWIADQRITSLRDDVAMLLEAPPPNPRYYLAVLAAVDWLDHGSSLRGVGIGDELLVRELRNAQRSPAMHALALRLLSPDHKFLTLDRLRSYLQAEYVPLRLEAVRSLAQQPNAERFQLLAAVARDEAQHHDVRTEAIVGLSAAAEQHQNLLGELAHSGSREVRREARRALRLGGLRDAPTENKPPADDLAAWQALLSQPGDAAAGRRLFFSPVGARCAVCHQHTGRGGRVGPDLTNIGRSASRERIVASILQPSQEIAPDYQPWLLLTKDGKTHIGLRPPKASGADMEHYFDSEGNRFSLPSREIAVREASSVSIMPDGMEKKLSIDDLRDLVTFLATPVE
jgi:putative heme-binding domain-containing protein